MRISLLLSSLLALSCNSKSLDGSASSSSSKNGDQSPKETAMEPDPAAQDPAIVAGSPIDPLPAEAMAPVVVAGAYLNCQITNLAHYACTVKDEAKADVTIPNGDKALFTFISDADKNARRSIKSRTYQSGRSPTFFVLELSSKELGTIEIQHPQLTTPPRSFNSKDVDNSLGYIAEPVELPPEAWAIQVNPNEIWFGDGKLAEGDDNCLTEAERAAYKGFFVDNPFDVRFDFTVANPKSKFYIEVCGLEKAGVGYVATADGPGPVWNMRLPPIGRGYLYLEQAFGTGPSSLAVGRFKDIADDEFIIRNIYTTIDQKTTTVSTY